MYYISYRKVAKYIYNIYLSPFVHSVLKMGTAYFVSIFSYNTRAMIQKILLSSIRVISSHKVVTINPISINIYHVVRGLSADFWVRVFGQSQALNNMRKIAFRCVSYYKQRVLNHNIFPRIQMQVSSTIYGKTDTIQS